MENVQLTVGCYYHIYNRGNNRCNLFERPEEYERFLGLYDKYISPVADTLAWVLMRNHFHFLVYIKKDVRYKYSLETLEKKAKTDKIWYEEHRWETVDLSACEAPDSVVENEIVDASECKKPVPYRHFSHLCNAYSRFLQTRTGRTGNLFERPFKRKIITNREYLRKTVLYIHNNPVHHGFCTHPIEYPWSSYISSVSEKPTKLKRDAVMELFNDRNNFIYEHKQKTAFEEIEKYLDNWIADDDFNDVRLVEDIDLSACAAPDNVKGLDEVGKFNAVRSEDADRFGEVDLSACAAPDNVASLNGGSGFNAVRSKDGDRLGEEDVDLSACAAPDNVMNEVGKFNAVRSEDADRFGEVDLSACAAPDNFKSFVCASPANVKKLTTHKVQPKKYKK